jgi:hypothetical protein
MRSCPLRRSKSAVFAQRNIWTAAALSMLTKQNRSGTLCNWKAVANK